MKKILIDTNIVIDLLAKRDPFYAEAAELFSKADKNEIELSISALSITTTHYILSQRLKSEEAKSILRKFKVLVKVIDLNDKIIELALNEKELKDFEDAVQYYSAIENNDQLIISRNLKDFKKSKLPVMTAAQYLGLGS
jgi:predicted nucleic acid-binding protein